MRDNKDETVRRRRPDPARRMAVLERQRKMAKSFWSSNVAGTAILAAVVGAITGLGAVGFIELIELCKRLFFNGGAEAFSALGKWYIVVLPVLGGIIVGPLVHFLAPEAKGHGVPEVMTAMETRGGRIRPRVALVKTVASAVTIGSGGAAGREGPIVQIGAAIGSGIGQLLKISRPRLLALVGAGAAGGIAATFNAPIAGLMFTLEVLVGEFSVAAVSSMVFAAVSDAEPREGIDFFPLTVDYREKGFSAGKIFGGRFYKREGRPTDKEILTMRMIDRPTRPLWPEGYTRDILITAMTLSADEENDPHVLAMVAASAALAVSPLPFLGPFGAVRIGRVGGELVVNPTHAQREEGVGPVLAVR